MGVPGQKASTTANSAASVVRSFIRSDSGDSRMLVLLRCVLAFSGLAIAWIDPTDVRVLPNLIYGPLAIYCSFSAIVAFDSSRAGWPSPPRYLHWIDVFFFAYLVAVSGRSNSFFVLFFFYPILVAAFSRGFREGLLLTFASMILFVTVDLLFLMPGDRFEQGRTVIHAGYLFVLGFMISYVGGYERLHRRKLALLKEINSQWHPRFGVDHVNGVNLERLLAFYGGTSCVLMVRRPAPVPHLVMYTASRNEPGHSSKPSNVDENSADALLRLPDTLAAYYHDRESPWWMRSHGYGAYDFDRRGRTRSYEEDCALWANMLDTQAFVTVPYSQRDGTTGRIFLTTDSGWFTQADIDFLAQASDAMATMIENMYLVEELISGAAEHERKSISRDLHDTTIQPYIGLKLALDALLREAGPENPLAPRISELINMAEMTVRDLRDYATTLKENTPMPGEFLVAAVEKQAERLMRFYGINVEVKSDITPLLKGRLAADAFQIISEGLSNILRHTSAKAAFVTVLCENANLLLEVGNEAGKDAGQFTPRSISDRAQALGGRVVVEHRADRYTVVHVSIPMQMA